MSKLDFHWIYRFLTDNVDVKLSSFQSAVCLNCVLSVSLSVYVYLCLCMSVFVYMRVCYMHCCWSSNLPAVPVRMWSIDTEQEAEGASFMVGTAEPSVGFRETSLLAATSLGQPLLCSRFFTFRCYEAEQDFYAECSWKKLGMQDFEKKTNMQQRRIPMTAPT